MYRGRVGPPSRSIGALGVGPAIYSGEGEASAPATGCIMSRRSKATSVIQQVQAAPAVGEPMAYVIAEPRIGTRTIVRRGLSVTAFTPPLTSLTRQDRTALHRSRGMLDCDAGVEACPVDACFADDQFATGVEGETALNEVIFGWRVAAGSEWLLQRPRQTRSRPQERARVRGMPGCRWSPCRSASSQPRPGGLLWLTPRRHASKHAAATGHPVIELARAGEDWSWCSSTRPPSSCD